MRTSTNDIEKTADTLHHDLKSIMKEAGEIALSHFKSGNVKKWEKKPGDPVSEADLAVDAFLKSALTELLPSAGWLSEETEDTPDRLDKSAVWIVDPIDGTRSYLKGTGDWGISVALAIKGRPVLAGLLAPARGAFYMAAADKGATLNGEPIAVSSTRSIQSARMMGDDSGFRSHYWPLKWPDSMTCTNANSIALRLCLVADGTADACVTLRPKHDWDVAAAHLILSEAGGILEATDREGFIYNKPKPLHRAVIASNTILQEALFDRVTPAIEAWRERQKQEQQKAE